MWRTYWTILAGIIGVAGCVGGPADGSPAGLASQSAGLYSGASDATIAQAFRPRFNFTSQTLCFPLTFQEVAADGSSTDRDALKSKCKGSYDNSFVVFASVQKPSDYNAADWKDESFRVSYGIVTGWQQGSFPQLADNIVNMYDSDVDLGNHDQDAQYLVVDVLNDSVNSVWADMHQGYYSRVRGQLTMYNTDHVTTWMGGYYHPLKLTDAYSTACSEWDYIPTALQTLCYAPCTADYDDNLPNHNSCGVVDTLMNWGDIIGTDHQADGKLVIVDDVCNTSGTSYLSPDGVTYSGTQLDALKAYIGCTGAAGQWDHPFITKDEYKTPYALKGCKNGDDSGGLICDGSNFGPDDVWTTFSGADRYLEPSVGGKVNVDHDYGTPFNDMISEFAAPSSITIRGGTVVDAVSVTYTNGDVLSHGGTGGSATTLSGLATDPIVSVYFCNSEYGDSSETMVGKIVVTTQSGRTLQGGSGSTDCQTIAPANKKFYGFFGRTGTYSDTLGTYWGNLANFETDTTKPTASNVTITSLDGSFTSSYVFYSSAGYPEVGSTFQWKRINGSTTTTVGTGRTYTPTSADTGLQIEFCVTPATRTATGNQTCSNPFNVVSYVTWYQNNNYGGATLSQVVPLNSTCVNLSSASFNDEASSVKVTGEVNSSNYVTTLFYFKDADCSGDSDAITAQAGTTVSTSSFSSSWNDEISSYKLQLGSIIWWFKDANYGGSHWWSTFNNGECINLSGFNDEASSLKLYPHNTDTTLTFYLDTDCGGTSYSMAAPASTESVISDLSSIGWNDKVSSFKVTW